MCTDSINASVSSDYYFALQSSWGLTKHMGGLRATKELVELCRVNKDMHILDVGCGVGITACYIAAEYGCKVSAVDISKDMIERAEERAKKKGLRDKIEFKVADAQALPFVDNSFDAVISESVNAFVEDKQKAINEYRRVTKPGGYVGFNEVTWIESPPYELVEYLSCALGGAKFLSAKGWESLLSAACFSEIVVRIYRTTAWRQWVSEIQEIEMRDFFSAWYRFILLFFKSHELRKYVKEICKPPKSVFSLFKYFGYGIYVGKK